MHCLNPNEPSGTLKQPTYFSIAIPDLSNAVVRFFGTRSCGDINDLNFLLLRFFENLQKRPGQLGLIPRSELFRKNSQNSSEKN